jgi:hypothetical protein
MFAAGLKACLPDAESDVSIEGEIWSLVAGCLLGDWARRIPFPQLLIGPFVDPPVEAPGPFVCARALHVLCTSPDALLALSTRSPWQRESEAVRSVDSPSFCPWREHFLCLVHSEFPISDSAEIF